MAQPSEAVRIEGLAELRRSLRALGDGTIKEVQKVSKRAAEIVAVEARSMAPYRSGRLAGSVRAGTSGNAGIVRSPLPYAAVHEYGGTIRPRGAPIVIRQSAFVGRALQRNQDRVLAEMTRGLDELARREGWR